jgi:quercetin dioxygenase-like cupin family protein
LPPFGSPRVGVGPWRPEHDVPEAAAAEYAAGVAEEARLADTGAGLVPQGDGWFVLNVRDAAWMRNDVFGARCGFEADGRLVKERPELEVQQHPQVGFKLHVLHPSKPSTMYHSESEQEDFLVLSGECLLIVEGEERRLSAWDFFHCAPNTTHSFVGAGEGLCVILMVGARAAEGTILYPRHEVALGHGAGVEQDTPSPQVAYSPFPHWRLGHPDRWAELPWSR